MVDEEVQIRKIPRDFHDIARVAMVLVEEAYGKALVNADILHFELAGVFEGRVGNLLVIEPPAVLAGAEA